MPDARVVAVLRQAGAAGGLGPVLSALCARGVPTMTFAHDHARAMCEQLRLEPRALDSFPADVEAAGTSLLLTGTSLEVRDDATLWRWASTRGIHSIGFVDSWVNLGERFAVDGKQFAAVPSEIACPDGWCASKLRALGCPAPLVVLGHPAFDELPTLAARRATSAAELRRSLVAGRGSPLMAFLSEPPTLIPDKSPGFTITDASVAFARALSSVASGFADPVTVAIRLHPREAADVAPPISVALQEIPNVQFVVTSAERHDLLIASDLVVGMTTMLLREAAYLGKRVISVQPHRTRPCPVVDGVPAVNVVTDPGALATAMLEALAAPARTHLPLELALPQWLEHIERYITKAS